MARHRCCHQPRAVTLLPATLAGTGGAAGAVAGRAQRPSGAASGLAGGERARAPWPSWSARCTCSPRPRIRCPPVFDAVFEQSSTLVEEVDLGASGDIAALLPTAAARSSPTARRCAPCSIRRRSRRSRPRCATTGMPLALVERMKPWLVSMLLVVPELTRAGFDPAHGLDRHYYDRAQAAGRTVRGLETAAYQVERLNGLPLPVQVEMLKATLDDVEAQVASVETIVTAWRTGDLATLDRLLLQSFRESPAIYQRLLVDRNRDWVPKIVAVRGRAVAVPGRRRRRAPARSRRARRPARCRRLHSRADVSAPSTSLRAGGLGPAGRPAAVPARPRPARNSRRGDRSPGPSPA